MAASKWAAVAIWLLSTLTSQPAGARHQRIRRSSTSAENHLHIAASSAFADAAPVLRARRHSSSSFIEFFWLRRFISVLVKCCRQFRNTSEQIAYDAIVRATEDRRF